VSYQHKKWGQKYKIFLTAVANGNFPSVMSIQCNRFPRLTLAGHDCSKRARQRVNGGQLSIGGVEA